METAGTAGTPTTDDARAPMELRNFQSALRDIYLARLERLLRLRQRHLDDLNPQGLRLLDRSIFAAYCDCRTLDAEPDARAVLHKADVSLKATARELPNQEDGAA